MRLGGLRQGRMPQGPVCLIYGASPLYPCLRTNVWTRCRRSRDGLPQHLSFLCDTPCFAHQPRSLDQHHEDRPSSTTAGVTDEIKNVFHALLLAGNNPPFPRTRCCMHVLRALFRARHTTGRCRFREPGTRRRCPRVGCRRCSYSWRRRSPFPAAAAAAASARQRRSCCRGARRLVPLPPRPRVLVAHACEGDCFCGVRGQERVSHLKLSSSCPSRGGTVINSGAGGGGACLGR